VILLIGEQFQPIKSLLIFSTMSQKNIFDEMKQSMFDSPNIQTSKKIPENILAREPEKEEEALLKSIRISIFPLIFSVDQFISRKGIAFVFTKGIVISNAHVFRNSDDIDVSEFKNDVTSLNDLEVTKSYHRPVCETSPDASILFYTSDTLLNLKFLDLYQDISKSVEKKYFLVYLTSCEKGLVHQIEFLKYIGGSKNSFEFNAKNELHVGCSGSPVIQASLMPRFKKEEPPKWIFQIIGVLYGKNEKDPKFVYVSPLSKEFHDIYNIDTNRELKNEEKLKLSLEDYTNPTFVRPISDVILLQNDLVLISKSLLPKIKKWDGNWKKHTATLIEELLLLFDITSQDPVFTLEGKSFPSGKIDGHWKNDTWRIDVKKSQRSDKNQKSQEKCYVFDLQDNVDGFQTGNNSGKRNTQTFGIVYVPISIMNIDPLNLVQGMLKSIGSNFDDDFLNHRDVFTKRLCELQLSLSPDKQNGHDKLKEIKYVE
jgi:hypothetical protein